MTENYHPTYNKEVGEWPIKKEGDSRPSDQIRCHSDALKCARELAVNGNTNLIIHDENVQILGSESADDIFTKIADKVEGAVGAVASAIKSQAV